MVKSFEFNRDLIDDKTQNRKKHIVHYLLIIYTHDSTTVHIMDGLSHFALVGIFFQD